MKDIVIGKVKIEEAEDYMGNSWEEGSVEFEEVNGSNETEVLFLNSDILIKYNGKRVKITIEEIE